MKALSIIGSYVGNLAELKELMELVRTGKVPPMPVHRHALAEADSVLASLRAGKVVGRAVLTVE
ncbi:ethanol-active dehydrogenase/acetaldehyde-active reductase [compost metagenome]